jgi:hypothetical protein
MSDEERDIQAFVQKSLVSRFNYGLELSQWGSYGHWSIEDAALLISGFPLPPYARDEDLTSPANREKQLLFKRVLRLAETYPDLKNGSTPTQWREWAASVNIPDPVVFRELAALNDREIATGKYLSDDLQHLKQAAFKFWASVDRDAHSSHPDNDAVAKWLVEKGYSQSTASVAASIIRPAWAAKGRKPRNE